MGVDEFVAKIEATGCKMTHQRYALLEALWGPPSVEMTVDEIHRRARMVRPDMSLDTVYRNLRRFVKLGVISEIKLLGRATRYLLNRHMHQHGLVCLNCGVEIPLGNCPIKELEAMAQEEYGFTISIHRIELLGYCFMCTSRRVDPCSGS